MKKALAMLLTLMMLLSLIPGLAAADDPVTVTAMWNAARPQNEFTEETRKYIEDTLGVNIELTQVSENFEQALALAVSSGDVPDLIWMDYDTYVSYAKEGLFYDIGDLVKNYPDLMEYVNTNGSGDYCWDRMTIDGAVYGVPTRSVNKTMYTAAIRQDWLDKLGLKVPETLDELTEVLRAFTEDDPDGDGIKNTYGASCTGLDYASVFFGAFGATSMMDYLLNDDGTITTNVISENYRSALRYLKDIYDKGYTNPGAESVSSNDANAMFQNQQLAISFTNSVLASNAKADMESGKAAKFDMRLANIPSENADPLTFTYVTGAAVFNTEDETRMKVSKDFVKFVSSDPELVKASKNGIPVRASVVEEFKDDNPLFAAYDENAKYMFNFTGNVPGYNQLRQVLYPELQALFTGEKSAEQVVKDYQEKGNQIIEESKANSVIYQK